MAVEFGKSPLFGFQSIFYTNSGDVALLKQRKITANLETAEEFPFWEALQTSPGHSRHSQGSSHWWHSEITTQELNFISGGEEEEEEEDIRISAACLQG